MRYTVAEEAAARTLKMPTRFAKCFFSSCRKAQHNKQKTIASTHRHQRRSTQTQATQERERERQTDTDRDRQRDREKNKNKNKKEEGRHTHVHTPGREHSARVLRGLFAAARHRTVRPQSQRGQNDPELQAHTHAHTHARTADADTRLVCWYTLVKQDNVMHTHAHLCLCRAERFNARAVDVNGNQLTQHCDWIEVVLLQLIELWPSTAMAPHTPRGAQTKTKCISSGVSSVSPAQLQITASRHRHMGRQTNGKQTAAHLHAVCLWAKEPANVAVEHACEATNHNLLQKRPRSSAREILKEVQRLPSYSHARLRCGGWVSTR